MMIMDVLIESAKHQLLPVFDEVTLPAMQAFGITPLTEPLIAAIFGAFVVACALYAVGVLFSLRLQRKDPERYATLRQKLGSTLLLALLVLGSPFGFVLAFSAGYLRTNIALSIPVALIGLLAHYGLAYG